MSLRKPTRRSSPVHIEPVRACSTAARIPPSVDDELVRARWQYGAEVRQPKGPGLPTERDRKKLPTDLPL